MATSRKPIWQVFAVMALTFVLGLGTAFASSRNIRSGVPMQGLLSDVIVPLAQLC